MDLSFNFKQPLLNVLNKDCFSLDFCCKLAKYLTPKELGALSQCNKILHQNLTLRTPVEGPHHILAQQSNSIMERVYFEFQDKCSEIKVREAKKKASRKMKRYLPLLNTLPNQLEIKSRMLRHRYRGVMGAVADLRVKANMLPENPYINESERQKEVKSLTHQFAYFQKDSQNIENQTRDILVNQLDDRVVRLKIMGSIHVNRSF